MPTASLFNEPMTVVELGDSIAGSLCGRFLRHLGASVLKVEPPGGSTLRATPPFVSAPTGERLSTTFEALNAGKDFATADLATPEGRRLVEDLVRSPVDVVVMSGTLTEWDSCGLSPHRLLEIAPRTIVGRITMFGDQGPYEHIAGGEFQALALGGLVNMIGEPEREPLRLGGSPAQGSAALALLSGVALGLYRRAKEGVGGAFATSVIETVSHVEWKGAANYQSDGVSVTRGSVGAGPAGLILRCRDGFFVFSYGEKTWPRLKELLADDRLEATEFSTPGLREEHREQLLTILNETTSKMAKHELYHLTQANGMLSGYMATMGDLLESEQYRVRDFLEPLDLGEFGRGMLPGAPWRIYERTAPSEDSAADEPSVDAVMAAHIDRDN